MATGTSTTAAKTYKYIQFDYTTFAAKITLNFPPYNELTVPMMVLAITWPP